MFGKNKKKALAISGGGSKGAFTGGIIEALYKEYGKDHDLYAGNSTGSLLQTLTSIKDFDSLKEGYTTIKLDDIYTISPFRDSSNIENPKTNWWGIFKNMVINGEPTFGNSKALKKTIKKFFPKDKFEKSLQEGKELITTVSNVSKVQTEYASSLNHTYEDFVDWSWISTNAIPFSSLVKRNGDYYADGGYMEHMPIQKCIDEGADEIDAITTKPMEFGGDTNIEIRNFLQVIERIIEMMLWETSQRDKEVAKLRAKDKGVKLNIIYAPRKLTDNSMYFDKDIMEEWWKEGYEYAKEGAMKQYIIDKNKKPKEIK